MAVRESLILPYGCRVGFRLEYYTSVIIRAPIEFSVLNLSVKYSYYTVCVKPTSASYEKGQTEVRRQIRSNRTRIEGSEGIRPALSPPVLFVINSGPVQDTLLCLVDLILASRQIALHIFSTESVFRQIRIISNRP
ncbi:hypothetical protein NQ318_002220 [Aromia moschata]|uniref:Uncharacterized protein n=1 Tax=Aromia moschata TaxID=1265417 RepID=A0AAV8Z2Q5_9CUCU|nr:hypothetical protein NQ318_002220 [Aromia moschata]